LKARRSILKGENCKTAQRSQERSDLKEEDGNATEEKSE